MKEYQLNFLRFWTLGVFFFLFLLLTCPSNVALKQGVMWFYYVMVGIVCPIIWVWIRRNR